jgi:hypothetical protein
MSETGAFGEIVEADSQSVLAECHALYRAPAFGSFVRADCVGSGRRHFGVVTRVCSGPFDGNRVVQAHGLPPGELEQKKPHLPTLLRTVFAVRLVGYGNEHGTVPGTAPQPPRLHCFVSPAAPEEVRALTERPDFLRPLTQAQDAPLEDLLASAIRTAGEAWPPAERHARLIAWGKYLARLLRHDYVTLEGVVRRVSPAPAPVPAPAGAAPASPAHPRYEEPLPLAGNGSARGYDPFEDR